MVDSLSRLPRDFGIKKNKSEPFERMVYHGDYKLLMWKVGPRFACAGYFLCLFEPNVVPVDVHCLTVTLSYDYHAACMQYSEVRKKDC
jgi:hypothetical protein